MAIRRTTPSNGQPGSAPAYYDPETEQDALVQRYVTLSPPPSKKNNPVIIGASGHAYPVWSVFLTYKIAGDDVVRAAEEYEHDLSPDQIRAAVRFAELYPDVVMPYVAPHLAEA